MRFIKYIPDSEISNYLESKPLANHLALIIAKRARRTDCSLNNLQIGQCFIGDYKKIGLTEQQYRTAKKELKRVKFATFHGTNKGTVATLVSTELWDINILEGNGLDNTPTTTNKNEKNLKKEEDSFDKRINKQLPFDVVSSSHTINALFENPHTAIDELKNIYQIEATEQDIKTAIHTFSTVAIASYDAYKGIRTIEKLKNKFLEWIPKSIKFQTTSQHSAKSDTKTESKPLDLESYILENHRPVDLKHMKKDKRFERWDKELQENSFRLANIAKAYKNQNISTMFLFELSYMPLGNQLSGSTAQRKLDSFFKYLKTISDYNQNFGDIRSLLKERNKRLA